MSLQEGLRALDHIPHHHGAAEPEDQMLVVRVQAQTLPDVPLRMLLSNIAIVSLRVTHCIGIENRLNVVGTAYECFINVNTS